MQSAITMNFQLKATSGVLQARWRIADKTRHDTGKLRPFKPFLWPTSSKQKRCLQLNSKRADRFTLYSDLFGFDGSNASKAAIHQNQTRVTEAIVLSLMGCFHTLHNTRNMATTTQQIVKKNTWPESCERPLQVHIIFVLLRQCWSTEMGWKKWT